MSSAFVKNIGELFRLACFAATLLLVGCASRNNSDLQALIDKQQKEIQRLTEQERKFDSRISQVERVAETGQAQLPADTSPRPGEASAAYFIGGGEYDTLFKDEVYFDLGDYHLSKQSCQSLDKLADAMTRSSNAMLEISGHADPSGPAFFNQLLSEQRAHAAMRYLHEKFDIPLHRMHDEGFGSEAQKYSNDIGEQVNKNRRIEIRLLIRKASHESS